ncbi:MAG: ribulose phosphate epimerase, partial [Maribacter sp.]|nr:ribulose phosphate epimerase [Maribacter sp.]
YTTKPCKITVLDDLPSLPDADQALRIGRHRPTSWVRIIIKEGKFRQVRKMTAAVGYPTVRLIRVRIGTIQLEKMNPRDVTPIQITLPEL